MLCSNCEVNLPLTELKAHREIDHYCKVCDMYTAKMYTARTPEGLVIQKICKIIEELPRLLYA